MGVLVCGLWFFNWVDLFVEVSVFVSGEYVIVVVGEVYLEWCIKDLKERFVCVELFIFLLLVEFWEICDIEVDIVDVDKIIVG